MLHGMLLVATLCTRKPADVSCVTSIGLFWTCVAHPIRKPRSCPLSMVGYISQDRPFESCGARAKAHQLAQAVARGARRFRGNRAFIVITLSAALARSALSCVASRQFIPLQANGASGLSESQQAYTISQVQPQPEPVSIDFRGRRPDSDHLPAIRRVCRRHRSRSSR